MTGVQTCALPIYYLKATALECLLGWLYLRGERDRISALFNAMMEETDDAT